MRAGENGRESPGGGRLGAHVGGLDEPPGSPVWRYERANTLADWTWTIALADSIGRVEREIAATLRTMAARDGGKAAARRLELAQDADRGAQAAAKVKSRLQELGRRSEAQADRAALRQALERAARLHAELASAEDDIADILAHMTSRNGSAPAVRKSPLASQPPATAGSAKDLAGRQHVGRPVSLPEAKPEARVDGRNPASPSLRARAELADQNVQQSIALARQSFQHVADALLRTASAHDRAADAEERSARSGVGDRTERGRKAAYQRAAAIADRQRAEEIRSQAMPLGHSE